MRLPARGLLLALIASSVACDRLSPRLVIVPTAGGVTLDMQTLGEYMTLISRIRISDDRGKVIWDVRARGQVPQLWTVALSCGSNSVFVPEHREYEVVTPKSSTFVLHAKATYEVEVWNPHSLLPARTSFSLSHCT